MLTQNTDHVAQAQGRILEQFKATTTHPGRVAAFAKQVQAIEDAAFGVLVVRVIASASGVQLDAIGKIVGAAREGLADADYRLRIRAQILVNRRSGEIETLLQICALLAPEFVPVLAETRPATVQITATGATYLPGGPAQLAAMLKKAKVAGVRLLLEYFTATPANTFTLDGTTAQGLDNGLLAGII